MVIWLTAAIIRGCCSNFSYSGHIKYLDDDEDWTWHGTSCPASRGIYSMIASRTRHFWSSASSTIAGKILWDNCFTPITWMHSTTDHSPGMKLSITS